MLMVAQSSTVAVDLPAPPLEQNSSERIAKIEAVLPYLATKTDIAELRAEVKADIAEVKADIAENRASIEKLKADLTWRIVIAMSIMTGVIALVINLSNA